MPRPPRIQYEDGIYHVTTRGNRRGPIFASSDDRELFLRLLRRVVRRYGWELHAYCLMTNHYHLALTTPEPNLSAGMCLLNGHYARAFNEIHGFTGHVFERRFHAELVTSERHLLHRPQPGSGTSLSAPGAVGVEQLRRDGVLDLAAGLRRSRPSARPVRRERPLASGGVSGVRGGGAPVAGRRLRGPCPVPGTGHGALSRLDNCVAVVTR